MKSYATACAIFLLALPIIQLADGSEGMGDVNLPNRELLAVRKTPADFLNVPAANMEKASKISQRLFDPALGGAQSLDAILQKTQIYPTSPMIFSVFGVKDGDHLPLVAEYTPIYYSHRAVNLGTCFDMVKGEFVAKTPGLYEFRWEAEKGSKEHHAKLWILKNDKDVIGRGYAYNTTQMTVRTYAHTWLNVGDRVNTRYMGMFSGANPVQTLTGSPAGQPFGHQAFLRFSGELIIKAPFPISVPCPPGACEAKDGVQPIKF